jgi:UDP-N-acetyl-D-mannosaminuronic acid dehydrogenase
MNTESQAAPTIHETVVPTNTTVCVLGLGYIGLPTASVLATKGFRVHGMDVRPEVVDTINAGRIHIEEPDLDIVVRSAVNSGQLKAGYEPQPADIFILCVPTPIRDDKSPDLSYVEQAARAIQPHVKPGNLIILESTSPPKTTENVVVPLAIPDGMVVGEDVFVAHCPERVLPGRILLEVVQNDRVVGGVTSACTEKALAFYKAFVNGKVLATSAIAAEVTKLVENSYRDVNIAFANELSILADKLGVDPWEIIELANRHPRVNILSPGPGVGGHCISVDPWFLIHASSEDTPLIRMAREVNDAKPHHVVAHIKELSQRFAAPKIGCLGITYKADVDDLRESPALDIVQALHDDDVGHIMPCDPYISSDRFTDFPLYDLNDVIEQCDILVLLTDHQQFKSVPLRVLQERVIVDTRGIWR